MKSEHINVGVVGALVSTFAELDVTRVVLHNQASLHTFGVTSHVIHVHSQKIVHSTGVQDTIWDTVSVYVNIDTGSGPYHQLNSVLPESVGAVLSNLIELDVTGVVLQFHAASHTFILEFVHVDANHSVFIIHVTGVHETTHTLSVYVNIDV